VAEPWKMPVELEPFRSFISDAGQGVEKAMNDYKQATVDFLSTDAGRALSVNVQIRLLVTLRAAGLLKEVATCPSSKTGG